MPPRPHSHSRPQDAKPGGNWKALQKSLTDTTSKDGSKPISKKRRISGTSLSAPASSGSTSSLFKGKARAEPDYAAPPASLRKRETGSGSGSPAPTALPWFAEDLSPEDLALVKNIQVDTVEGKGTSQPSWSGWTATGSIEEQRRKKAIILGGQGAALSGPAGELKREPGTYIAIDCEMVGVGVKGSESVLARVSIVNWHGHVLLDRFVKPQEKVTDYRTWVSGVRARDLQNAPSFREVQAEVAELIKGRVLVGHAIHNDLSALLLSHPRPLIRDTATFQPLRDLAKTKFPGLRKLAQLVLGIEIQQRGEEHSSVEDARTTMAIFRTQKDPWEKSLKSKNLRDKAADEAWDEAAAAVGKARNSKRGGSDSGSGGPKAKASNGNGSGGAAPKVATGPPAPLRKKRTQAAPGWWKEDA